MREKWVGNKEIISTESAESDQLRERAECYHIRSKSQERRDFFEGVRRSLTRSWQGQDPNTGSWMEWELSLSTQINENRGQMKKSSEGVGKMGRKKYSET